MIQTPMKAELVGNKQFRTNATTPAVWNTIGKDVDSLILLLGLTGNHAMPYHSPAQHRIMRIFNQHDPSCNGEALDVALSAAAYVQSEQLGGIVIPQSLIDYGDFLTSRPQQVEMPRNLDSMGYLLSTGISVADQRLKDRALAKSLPLSFGASSINDSMGKNSDTTKKTLAQNPEAFAEAYRQSLFETAMHVIFTNGTGATYSTMPTGVFSRDAIMRDGKITLGGNSDIIHEIQATSRAKEICDLLLNNERFELGKSRTPNLPYIIGAIRLGLENAQEMYKHVDLRKERVAIDIPTPGMDYFSER